MTSREYIDEVKLRQNRLGVTTGLNDALILNYVNKARRDVQVATMAVIPERYGRRDTLSLTAATAVVDTDDTMQHLYYAGTPIQVRRFALPGDYLEILSLWISHSENDGMVFREARRTNKRELFNIKTHCFNMPTIDRPVFVLESKQQNYIAATDNICYIAGLESVGQNIFNSGNVLIEIWAIVAITDFDTWNETETIFSSDLQEYVIKQAMVYCTNNINAMQLKQSLQIDVDTYKQTVLQNYSMFKDQPIHQLPSQEGL